MLVVIVYMWEGGGWEESGMSSDAWLGSVLPWKEAAGCNTKNTNHDISFAHYGAAKPGHPEPGLQGILL